MGNRDIQAIESVGYDDVPQRQNIQQSPQVVYIQQQQPQISKTQEAASLILLAYVAGFVIISLITGVMMFL